MFNMKLGFIEHVDGKEFFAVSEGASGTPVFGPYTKLGRGNYVAEFIVLVSPEDRVLSSETGTIGSIDACSDNGHVILAQTSLTIENLKERRTRLLLAFQVLEDKFVELRVHTFGRVRFQVAVDREIRTIRDYGSFQFKEFLEIDVLSPRSGFLAEQLEALFERSLVAGSSLNSATQDVVKTPRFDQVISLGAWCQLTEQLRSNKIGYVSSPFDWLVTPFQSLVDVLSDSGRRLLTSFRLNSRGDTVVCNEYGVLYHHEFARDAVGGVVVDDDKAKQSRSKLSYKMDQFLKACTGDKTTLFIRLGGFGLPAEATPYNRENVPFATSNLSKLADLIASSFPHLKFSILFVYFQETTDVVYDCVSDSRVSVREMPWPKEPLIWEGDANDWKRLFQEFDLPGSRDLV